MSGDISEDDQARMEFLARAAGLDLALAQFPADIRKAFLSAEQLRRELSEDLPPSQEPWPPMRVDGPR